MINPQTEKLLKKFSKIALFKEHSAILIGGTALAFHLGHRESFDLDICFPISDKLPSLEFLKEFDEVISIDFDQEIIDTAINDGGNIEDMMQRFIIDGIKVDFVINPSSNIYESEILKKDNALQFGTLRIASIKTIFKLKSLLLLDRNKIRDLYDIVYLLKNQGFQGEDILDTIQQYRITYLKEDIIELIKSKKEDPFDIEGIENPKMKLTKYNELKTYLLKNISKGTFDV